MKNTDHLEKVYFKSQACGITSIPNFVFIHVNFFKRHKFPQCQTCSTPESMRRITLLNYLLHGCNTTQNTIYLVYKDYKSLISFSITRFYLYFAKGRVE